MASKRKKQEEEDTIIIDRDPVHFTDEEVSAQTGDLTSKYIQLQNENRLLRLQLHELQSNNKPPVNSQSLTYQVSTSTTTIDDTNGDGTYGTASLSSKVLPEEILQEIFKQLKKLKPNQEQIKWILNCRLVSSNWKNALDNCPDLMRQLCWIIYSPREFLNSTIATKVKSIKFIRDFQFQQCDQQQQQQLETLFNTISNNVESIIFEFPKKSEFLCKKFPSRILEIERQSQLFTFAMLKCHKLKELQILTSNREFLTKFNSIEMEICCTNIKSLVLNVQQTNYEEISIINEFILGLSSLESLVLFYDVDIREDDMRARFLENGLVRSIIGHIEKFPGSLKKVHFEGVESPEGNQSLLQAVITQNVDIDFGSITFHLDELFFNSDYDVPALNDQNCRSLKQAKLTLDIDELISFQNLQSVGHFINLEKLQIIFERSSAPNELKFLLNLRKLHELELTLDFNFAGEINTQDFLPGGGLQSLEILSVFGDHVFRTEQAFNSFHLYFPNLHKLCLFGSEDVSLGFLISLSKIDSLVDLGLSKCGIRDEAFTQQVRIPQQQQQDESLQPVMMMVPVIASFKKLKSLMISRCPLLTDRFLIDGIAFNQTLIFLGLKWDRNYQFTNEGINAVLNSGRLKVSNEMSAGEIVGEAIFVAV